MVRTSSAAHTILPVIFQLPFYFTPIPLGCQRIAPARVSRNPITGAPPLSDTRRGGRGRTKAVEQKLDPPNTPYRAGQDAPPGTSLQSGYPGRAEGRRGDRPYEIGRCRPKVRGSALAGGRGSRRAANRNIQTGQTRIWEGEAPAEPYPATPRNPQARLRRSVALPKAEWCPNGTDHPESAGGSPSFSLPRLPTISTTITTTASTSTTHTSTP